MNEFTIISLEQDSLYSLIVFEINNISDILRKTCVGQFVKSCTFDLNFPTSIRKSKWVVILFFNGQYDHRGAPDKRISVYLKLMTCERESTAIKFDAEFRLGSGHGCKQNQILCFNDVTRRWIATHLQTVNEIITNNCPDTLLLSIHLIERSAKNSSLSFGAGAMPAAMYDFCHSSITKNVNI